MINKQTYKNFFIVFVLLIIVFIYGYTLYSTYQENKAEKLSNQNPTNKILQDSYKREISKTEIEKFVPVNYSFIKNNFNNETLNIKKIETKKGFMYLLPLTFTGIEEGKGVIAKDKIILLNYDNKNDSYKIVDEFLSEGKVNVKNFVDIDFDNEKELFVIFSWSAGSGTHHDVFILDIDLDAKKINTIDNNISLFNTEYFREINGIITTAQYIWDFEVKESHFGCHYFNINKYKYDINKKKVKEITTVRSQNEYSLDYGEGMLYVSRQTTCFYLPKNFYELLKKENIDY